MKLSTGPSTMQLQTSGQFHFNMYDSKKDTLHGWTEFTKSTVIMMRSLSSVHGRTEMHVT